MATTRGRVLAAQQVVYDLADIFSNDGFTRVAGLTASNFSLQVYLNNTLLGWTLVNGASVIDAQVLVGKVYISSLSGGPYSIRWRPSSVGFWRINLTYPAGFQVLAQEYDVLSDKQAISSGAAGSTPGLQTSFIR